MSPALFRPQRADGRSAAQVLIDTVKEAAPGTVFTFAQLQEALNIGGTRAHTVPDVRQAVRAGFYRLLNGHARRMHNVRRVGYRLSPASQHMALARTDSCRADVQLRKGRDTLRHVRWEELDENTRKAHEGHLMITEVLYANQAALHRRISKIEAALKGVL